MAVNTFLSQRAALTCYAALSGVCLIEFQFPSTGVNLGNLALVLFTATALLIDHRGGTTRPTSRPLYWMDAVFAAYLSFCGISAIWSPSPQDTAAQTLFGFAIWTCSYILRSIDIVHLIRIVVSIALLVAIISLLLVFIGSGSAFQPYSSSGIPELRGVLGHQQRLGLFMGTVIGLLAIAALNGDIKDWRWPVGRIYFAAAALLICFIWALARLYSAFAVLAFLAVVLMTRSKWSRFGFTGIGLILLTVAFSEPGLILSIIDAQDTDLTLTGRTVIWERTAAAAANAGLLGYGFGSFTSPTFDWLWGVYRAPSAHNSLLQAYFETGVVGVLLTSAFALAHFSVGIRVSQLTGRYSYSSFLSLIAVLSSITGVTYAGKPSILLSLILIVSACEITSVRRWRIGYEQGFTSSKPPMTIQSNHTTRITFL